MSKCIICGKAASPEFFCEKKDMLVALCEEHACECDDCGMESCTKCGGK